MFIQHFLKPRLKLEWTVHSTCEKKYTLCAHTEDRTFSFTGKCPISSVSEVPRPLKNTTGFLFDNPSTADEAPTTSEAAWKAKGS